jgi:hypothetical protein
MPAYYSAVEIAALSAFFLGRDMLDEAREEDPGPSRAAPPHGLIRFTVDNADQHSLSLAVLKKTGTPLCGFDQLIAIAAFIGKRGSPTGDLPLFDAGQFLCRFWVKGGTPEEPEPAERHVGWVH